MSLVVTFATASPFLSNPSSLASAHPALHNLQYTKPAGELSDALVFTVPATNARTDEIVEALKSLEGVLRVDKLVPRMRTKRDEF